MIRLEHVSKYFRVKHEEICAAKDIDLTIEKGEIFGIIGFSGAGKSTLVRCINLLEKPTGGHIYFHDTDLQKVSGKELRKIRQKIGMIFQQFNLMEQRNVIENVCYPMEIAGMQKKERKERARELLELVGLSDKEKAYPSQLSGGQKQRVAIARALATNPEVLLCDEATSALDPMTTRSILELLQKINREYNVTIIIITHEMSVVKQICDRVAVMSKGRVVELGDSREVFTNPQSKTAKSLVFHDYDSDAAADREAAKDKENKGGAA